MLKKRLLLVPFCAALALMLTGCGDGKVQSTVSEVISQAGDDISGAVSRVESALDSMFEDGSRADSEGGMVSDGDSRLESGGNLDSDLAEDGIVDDEGSTPSSSEDGVRSRTR